MTSPVVPPPPPRTFGVLAELVENRTGLYFQGSRRAELETRAAHGFAGSGCQSWEAYVTRLSKHGSALFTQLIETLTIGETYFFRHHAYFDELERTVLPELIAQQREARRLRVWCAGCATGEEAYSVAILVRRLVPDFENWQVTILATDLNRQFLARAQAGVYGQWSFRETDPAFQSSYFTAEGGRYRIQPKIQQLVQFDYFNLAGADDLSNANAGGGFDLILCRNVLIYFAADLAKRIVGRLRTALVPRGWLMLGPSDPTPPLMPGFEMHIADGAILYQRDDRSDIPPQWLMRSLAQVAPPAATVDGTPLRCTSTDPEPIPAQLIAGWTDWHIAWRDARASADAGRLDEAEMHCQRAIAGAALRPEPYYLLGTIRQARGDEQAALNAFRQALYADGAFVPALLGQAALYRRRGDEGRATHILARARRLLDGRDADEAVLAEEGLTVGRLRDALLQAQGQARAEHS